jgi:hypothetical protein
MWHCDHLGRCQEDQVSSSHGETTSLGRLGSLLEASSTFAWRVSIASYLLHVIFSFAPQTTMLVIKIGAQRPEAIGRGPSPFGIRHAMMNNSASN